MSEKTCAYCREPFRGKNVRYCSLRCRNYGRWQGPREKLDRRKRCELCGDQFIARKMHQRFCSRNCSGTHTSRNFHPRGVSHPRYVGGITQDSDGRKYIDARDRSKVIFARAVVEAHIGRALRSEEIVHHINGDCTDDRIENLRVMSRPEHMRLHAAQRRAAKIAA